MHMHNMCMHMSHVCTCHMHMHNMCMHMDMDMHMCMCMYVISHMLPPNGPPSKASDDASSAASRYAFGPRAAAPGYMAGASPLRGARALCGRPRGGAPGW